MTLRHLLSWIPLTILALVFYVGCPSEDETDDDDDSAVGDDDVADDDVADDDSAADDDAADDDAADDDTATGDPNIVADPHTLNFGTVSVGSDSTLPLAIINTGDGPLEVFEMYTPLPAITFTAFVGVIPPQGNEVVQITATCTAEEEVIGNLMIVSDDADENPLRVQVILLCDEV